MDISRAAYGRGREDNGTIWHFFKPGETESSCNGSMRAGHYVRPSCRRFVNRISRYSPPPKTVEVEDFRYAAPEGISLCQRCEPAHDAWMIFGNELEPNRATSTTA